MRTFIPQLIAIVAICILLSLNADAATITARADHDSPIHVPGTTDVVVCDLVLLNFLFVMIPFQSRVQGLHVTASIDVAFTSHNTTTTSSTIQSASTTSSTTSFTSACRAPQDTRPSFAPQNPTFVPRPFAHVVPTLSSSTGSPITKTTSRSDGVWSALEFDVVSATPSPSTTPFAAASFFLYFIFGVFLFMIFIAPFMFCLAHRRTPTASHVELVSVPPPPAPPIHPLFPSS